MSAFQSSDPSVVLPGRDAAGAARSELRFIVVLSILLLVLFVVSGSRYDAGRPDFFYLADAFLHGRTWIDQAFGLQDVVRVGDHVYLPFSPFPGIAYMPLVAVLGPASASKLGTLIDAGLATVAVVILVALARRLGISSRQDRLWVALLLALSTPVWWLVTRGGVWHEAQLLATVLTLGALLESFGRRRGWVLGLLAGAGLLTRATLLLAVPFYGWVLLTGGSTLLPRDLRRVRVADIVGFVAPVAVAGLFTLWYNDVRFGSPLESGYALAVLPPFLEQLREEGLFSVQHVGMNLDYLLVHLPRFSTTFPFLEPDGFGMSIFLTSPGLLLAARADWRSPRVLVLALTAVLVLIPTLLYYGGGWLQYGYRYALDSIPFVLAVVAMAVARHGLPWWGRLLIVAGIAVNLIGVYWAYRL